MKRVNGTGSISRLVVMTVGLAVSGCTVAQRSTPTVNDRIAEGPPAARQDAAPTPDNGAAVPAGRPAATVNGVAIDRREFLTTLLESRGLPLLQRMILRELARQEAERAGISIEPADLDREYELMILDTAKDDADAAMITPARRERFIEELVRVRGWTRAELDLVVERQTYLRRLAEQAVTVDEPMLRKEYERAHGEKSVVRHIQLAAPRYWPPLRQRLDAGEDFAELARTHSENRLSRADGGLLPPFSRDDPTVPETFRAVAFALEPGQVSNPIQYEGAWHVLKLERRIPASDIPFEEAADELRALLRARLVQERMDAMSAELFRRCELRIDDPILRALYESAREKGEFEGPTLVP